MKINKKILLYISILSLFICTAGGTLENSALQTIIDACPSISPTVVRMITTLPSLISMFVMIGVGKVVGNKIPYRFCVLFGLTCMIIGGLTPYVINSYWPFILFCRIIIGIGVGCAALGNPLLMRSVEPTKLSKYIGLGGVTGSIAGVLLNPMVGSLSKLGWKYAFLANSVYIIPFVLCLFFLVEPDNKNIAKKEVSKKKLPSLVYFFIVFQFISTMVLYPLLSGISTYLSSIGITDTTIAGMMLSIYTIGCVCGNLFLPTIHKTVKKNTLVFGCSLVVLGISMVLFSKIIPLISIGIFLSGMGFITIMATLQVYNGLLCEPDQMANASTKVLAANQMGVFLSNFFITATAFVKVFNNEISNTLFVCLIIYILLGIAGFFTRNVVSDLF